MPLLPRIQDNVLQRSSLRALIQTVLNSSYSGPGSGLSTRDSKERSGGGSQRHALRGWMLPGPLWEVSQERGPRTEC